MHQSIHSGDYVVKILELSMTALVLIITTKLPEISEICCISSYI